MEFIIQEKLGGENSHIDITLFPGLKLYSDVLPATKSNLYSCGGIRAQKIYCLSAKFTKAFKRKMRQMRKEKDLHRVD